MKSVSNHSLTKEELLVLHRHWVWANVMKKHFDQALREARGKNFEDWFPDRCGAYMCLWYGLLYNLIDQMKKRAIQYNQAPLAAQILNSLRQFRNAVFHPQPKYWSNKFFEIAQDKDSAGKIRDVHEGLGKFFLEELRRLKKGKGKEKER